MAIQDLSSARTQSDKVREEQAIVSAVARHFEKVSPSGQSPSGKMESSILTALDRYFEEKR